MLDQLNIDKAKADPTIKVHFGGPVSPGQGFVLHSTDFMREGSLRVGDEMGLTNTVDVLRAMALGQGPKRALLALGYAGWSAGQLDAEIQANGWLNSPADADLIFDMPPADKWKRAVGGLGIDLAALSAVAGHA
jgi:putative transcriptional regulator